MPTVILVATSPMAHHMLPASPAMPMKKTGKIAAIMIVGNPESAQSYMIQLRSTFENFLTFKPLFVDSFDSRLNTPHTNIAIRQAYKSFEILAYFHGFVSSPE